MKFEWKPKEHYAINVKWEAKVAFIKNPKKTEEFSDALLTAVAAQKLNGQVDIFRNIHNRSIQSLSCRLP